MFIIVLASGNFKLKIDHKKLIIFLGLTNGIAYLMQYIGMNSTTAAKASLFINLTTIWVALISPKVSGEHFGKYKTFGILSGIIGLLLVTTNLNLEIMSQGQLLGDLIVILAGVVWAFFIVYNKILVDKQNGVIQSIVWILPLTVLPTIPFVLFSASSIFLIPVEGWMVIVYTAVFCWVIPYYLWLEGLKHISASTSTILLLSEILIATIISVVLLEEIITLITGIGAIFIIAAILLVSKQSNNNSYKQNKQ
jgi:drug/metabolite transporter (DMT)-like permease